MNSPNAEAKIRWVSVDHRHHTGGLEVELPPGTPTIDFVRHYADYGLEQENLQALIGCSECPQLNKFPSWAHEEIRPWLGQRHGETTQNPPRVEIVCEGTDKMAKGGNVCVPRFQEAQTVRVKLG